MKPVTYEKLNSIYQDFYESKKLGIPRLSKEIKNVNVDEFINLVSKDKQLISTSYETNENNINNYLDGFLKNEKLLTSDIANIFFDIIDQNTEDGNYDYYYNILILEKLEDYFLEQHDTYKFIRTIILEIFNMYNLDTLLYHNQIGEAFSKIADYSEYIIDCNDDKLFYNYLDASHISLRVSMYSSTLLDSIIKYEALDRFYLDDRVKNRIDYNIYNEKQHEHALNQCIDSLLFTDTRETIALKTLFNYKKRLALVGDFVEDYRNELDTYLLEYEQKLTTPQYFSNKVIAAIKEAEKITNKILKNNILERIYFYYVPYIFRIPDYQVYDDKVLLMNSSKTYFSKNLSNVNSDMFLTNNFCVSIKYINESSLINDLLITLAISQMFSILSTSSIEAKITSIILKKVMDNKPEMFLNIYQTRTLEEVLARKDKILNHITKIVFGHNIGKTMLTSVTNVKTRHLTKFEINALNLHPVYGANYFSHLLIFKDYYDAILFHNVMLNKKDENDIREGKEYIDNPIIVEITKIVEQFSPDNFENNVKYNDVLKVYQDMQKDNDMYIKEILDFIDEDMLKTITLLINTNYQLLYKYYNLIYNKETSFKQILNSMN